MGGLSLSARASLRSLPLGPAYRETAGVLYDAAFSGTRASERVTTLYEPRGAAPVGMANAQGERPGVVVVYGGGFPRPAPGVPLWVGRWLAEKGYVASVPEYRAVYSATQGTAPDDGVTARDSTADVCAAVAHLASLPAVDEDRIIVIGHSTGGQVASTITTNPGWLGAVGVALSQVAGVIPIDHASYSLDAFGGKPAVLDRGNSSVSADLTKTWGFTRSGTPNANNATAADGGTRYDSDEIYYPGYVSPGVLSVGSPEGFSPVFYVNDDLPPQWIPYVGREDGGDGPPSVGYRAEQAKAWKALVDGRPRVSASGGVALYPIEDAGYQHDEMITKLGLYDESTAAAYSAAALAAMDGWVGVTR